MTVAVKTSGSQAATVTTEHDLATVTDANVYILAIDVNALAFGATSDELEIRIYGKARSSDTERLMHYNVIYSAQAILLWQSLPVVSPHHMRCTIKQTQGTSRTFPWAIYATQ